MLVQCTFILLNPYRKSFEAAKKKNSLSLAMLTAYKQCSRQYIHAITMYIVYIRQFTMAAAKIIYLCLLVHSLSFPDTLTTQLENTYFLAFYFFFRHRINYLPQYMCVCVQVSRHTCIMYKYWMRYATVYSTRKIHSFFSTKKISWREETERVNASASAT